MALPSDKRPIKSGTKKNGSAGTRSGASKSSAAKKSAGTAPARSAPKKSLPDGISPSRDPSSIRNQLIPCILGVLAILLAVCYILPGGTGAVGGAIRNFCVGLFGGGAYALPVILVYVAAIWRKIVPERAAGARVALGCGVMVLLSALLHAFAPEEVRTYSISTLYGAGKNLSGGGVIGGLLGTLLLRGFDFAGTLIIVMAALLLFTLFFLGGTPKSLIISIRYHIKRRRERLAAEDEAYRAYTAVQPDDPYVRVRGKAAENMRHASPANAQPQTPAAAPIRPAVQEARGIFRRRRRFDPDIPLENDRPVQDGEPVTETEEELLPDDVPVTEDIQSPEQAQVQETPAVENPQEEENPVDAEAFDEALRKTEENPTQDPLDREEEIFSPELDWKKIFVNPVAMPDGAKAAGEGKVPEGDLSDSAEAELEIDVRRVGTETGETVGEEEDADGGDAAPGQAPTTSQTAEATYFFPPLELLHEDDAPEGADENELRANAKKLVDTLTSFNVKTKIVDISRGPTITRYELQPEPGTRVRSIANLVDDIALNLATTGVRIEAPIPGKSAVGIEVPNRTAATVYLRGLLESEQFETAPSKLTAALGKDVAGSPIYFDIAKMPHLLIAGATGMGKSVSINSIIVSLLYKARPDEVKLILIDPKKVELNVYNGLPHLLVPVVSDPKKAAGSLSWAVTEMERRFTLIEDVGARDIKSYNSLTARDPEREFMPQVVIIIDELADLMMTAPDDVEDSICRLAQKARAAGMHLIIGTQRPSVDVITGLIKANVPSRIAFTVASQVDSRTIIDVTGAEKLIGRGDMLYAPVGAAKPHRVQGAFVSEEEIEKITDFIKSHAAEPQKYSDEVIASIERAAELCGVKKSSLAASTLGGADDEEGSDPMLRAALELAVDSGKISTSLIQRKLSLGYGRAAKLIDRMEELGYVGAPEGQKPREVLITKQQFMEMVVKDDDIG